MPEINQGKLKGKMWLWVALGAVLILLIVAIFLRGFSGEDDWICSNNQWVKHGNPSAPMPATGCGTSQAVEYQGVVSEISNDQLKIKISSVEEIRILVPGDIELIDNTGRPIDFGALRKGFTVIVSAGLTADNVNIARQIKVIAEPNIIVFSPQPEGAIGNPVTIKGEARVFESTFNIRIKDSEGNVLVEKTAMAYAPDAGQYGPFEVSVNYTPPKTNNGIVEVFDYSAKDGSVIDLVSIPVAFQKVETMKVNVYFGNSKTDPNAANCNKAYAAEREIPKTEAPARAALEALLGGPDATEKEAGYFTSINSGVIIQKLAIENGVAKADFSKELEQSVGGSCRVAAIRAQITETLKQFATVKSVVISIDGRTEDILQP